MGRRHQPLTDEQQLAIKAWIEASGECSNKPRFGPAPAFAAGAFEDDRVDSGWVWFETRDVRQRAEAQRAGLRCWDRVTVRVKTGLCDTGLEEHSSVTEYKEEIMWVSEMGDAALVLRDRYGHSHRCEWGVALRYRFGARARAV